MSTYIFLTAIVGGNPRYRDKTLLYTESLKTYPNVLSILLIFIGGGWFGSGKKNKNPYSNNYGNNNNYYGGKKKSGTMKTLKKAAVIGAVAYGGYQARGLNKRRRAWGENTDIHLFKIAREPNGRRQAFKTCPPVWIFITKLFLNTKKCLKPWP